MPFEPTPLALSIAALLAYLVGSIPFGLIITRLGGAGDVRNIGSGNIGATNVLRTGRKGLALATLICDGGKGAVAVLVARWAFAPDFSAVAAALCGAAAFFGHIFPLYLKFKGGKGVATFFGVMLAIAWPVGVLCAATWLAAAYLSRYSSMGALSAAALGPIYALLLHQPRAVVALALVLAVVIYVRHHENIRRLLAGEESKIGGSKRKPAA